MKLMIFVLLIPSLLLNVVLAFGWTHQILEGCAEVADGKVGILKEDVIVGAFDSGEALFTLPKGLVVRDASASGVGWFEPHRFRVVVTSDRTDLIDYSSFQSAIVNQDSEYYSADTVITD